MNQKLIAKEAGVSHSTVAVVFGAKGRVSEKTRCKVLRIAEKYHYHPDNNMDARRMISRRLGRPLRFRKVAVLWPMNMGLVPEVSYINEMLHGIMEGCDSHNLSLLIVNAAEMERLQRGEPVHDLNVVDGVIVPIHMHGLEAMMEGMVPRIVVTFPQTAPDGVAALVWDHAGMLRAAVDHLVERGHRRIGFVGTSQDILSRERARLVQEELLGRGLEADPRWTILEELHPAETNPFDFYRYKGRVAMGKLLDMPGRRPTAVIGHNDAMAIGAIEEAVRQGLDIPRHLSVMGIEGIPQGALAPVPLTTVDVHLREQGATAVDLVEEMLQGAGCRRLSVRFSVLERGSVGWMQED